MADPIWKDPTYKNFRISILQKKIDDVILMNDDIRQLNTEEIRNNVKTYKSDFIPLIEHWDKLPSEKKKKHIENVVRVFGDDLADCNKTFMDEYGADVKGLSDKRQFMARVGCSFSVSTFEPIKQPFYYCLTCNVDQTLGICEQCKEFCHAGHNIKKGNYGMPLKMICDCGAGEFDNQACPLNDKNPIASLRGENVCAMR